jgi:hypothetical protein
MGKKCCQQHVGLTLIAVFIMMFSSGSAQVLSRLGAVSDDAPGVQSVFEGNWIYSLSSSKLVITLEANPAIVKRGALPFPGGREGYGTAIAKSGNYLYVANDVVTFPSGSYLTVVNVSNPATPSVVADLALPSSIPTTLQIVKNGNYLYMFPESGDMQVVDVSNPAAPALVRSVSMTASGGVVVGNRLYTAERANGVGVWDVSQPDNPTRIGSVSLSGNITEVAVAGSTLYALSGFGSPAVHLLSLATPDSPTLQSTFSTNYTADMVVYGNYLYLSSGLGNTQIVDVSNPASPSAIGIFEIGRVRAVDGATARLLTAGGSWMRLYSLTTPSNPLLTTEYSVPAPRAAFEAATRSTPPRKLASASMTSLRPPRLCASRPERCASTAATSPKSTKTPSPSFTKATSASCASRKAEAPLFGQITPLNLRLGCKTECVQGARCWRLHAR